VTVRLARALLALFATTATVLALGIGTASAHVSVSSADADAGGFGELTFRVPTESDPASTTSLRVQLPTDTPLAFVSVKPVPGWTATVTTTPLDPPVEVEGSRLTEAVTEISWTADPGAGIRPGEYQSFSISAGPLPDAESLVLPALQGYDDGTEVAWIEPSTEGQAEPEHPAPVLNLAAASDEAGAADTSPTPAAAADGGTSGLAVTALVVGVAGLLAGIAGVALALGARRRTGATPSAVDPERPRVNA
jgi:periplasmic copper chaperone A